MSSPKSLSLLPCLLEGNGCTEDEVSFQSLEVEYFAKSCGQISYLDDFRFCDPITYFAALFQVNTMETNPFMRTSISDLVHVRNEAYKGLALEVDLVEERLIEVETIVTSLGSGMDTELLDAKLINRLKVIAIVDHTFFNVSYRISIDGRI